MKQLTVSACSRLWSLTLGYAITSSRIGFSELKENAFMGPCSRKVLYFYQRWLYKNGHFTTISISHREHFQLFFVGMFPIYMNKIPLELYTLGRQKTFAAHGSWLNMTDDFLPLPLFTMPYIIMLINFEERTKKGKERDNK